MKAMQFHGQGDLRVEDVPEPEVRPGTVKLAVDWCGICGSDLHEYLAGPIFIPEKEPHPITGETLPLTMGHEFAGRVTELGDGVDNVSVGDAVVVEPVIRDHTCPRCQRGAYNVCANIGFLGLHGFGGGFSEFVVAPDYMLHRLPEGMDTEQGALVEPIAVGFHAVRKSGIKAGDTALVMGAGPIGLVTMLCLRAAGASLIAVAEVADARKKMALDLGADVVLDPSEQDVVAEAGRLTNDGFDATFDCAGLPVTLNTAIHAVRPHGTAVNVAIWEGGAEIAPNDLVLTEVNLVGSLCYANEHPSVMQLIADQRIEASQLITGRIKLDDIIEQGFRELVDHKDRNIKILVQP